MAEHAFDRVAASYDAQFTDTEIGRRLRGIVWQRLGDYARPGARVLEIGCGTGEDAVWLARQGARVIATDISPAMLDIAGRKVRRAGVADRVEVEWMDAAAPPARPPGEGAFALAFSNFGALNCVANLRPLAGALARWVEPGGSLMLVVMNRWCAWEILWHWLHLRPRAAFRRLSRGGIEARVGEGAARVWYPSIRLIRQVCAPAFCLRRTTGLGVLLPPTYLEPLVATRPRLFGWLVRLEPVAAPLPFFRSMADHVILEFVRRP